MSANGTHEHTNPTGARESGDLVTIVFFVTRDGCTIAYRLTIPTDGDAPGDPRAVGES